MEYASAVVTVKMSMLCSYIMQIWIEATIIKLI